MHARRPYGTARRARHRVAPPARCGPLAPSPPEYAEAAAMRSSATASVIPCSFPLRRRPSPPPPPPPPPAPPRAAAPTRGGKRGRGGGWVFFFKNPPGGRLRQ